MGIGALLLGYYEDGKLVYAGRSGTGFTQKTHRMIRARLEALKRKESPFSDIPREVKRTAHWVKPELVAQISFSTWTRDHLVRQAAFKGLREDKPANEVVREEAVTPNAAKRNGSINAQVATESGSSRARTRTERKRGTVDGLAITHPDKVLDPDSGMTKQGSCRILPGGFRPLASPHFKSAAQHRALPRRQQQAVFFPKARRPRAT